MTLQTRPAPPQKGAGHDSTSVSPTKAKGTTKAPRSARITYQYQVSYRREDWTAATKTKSRTFARRADAEAFYDKLTAGQRPELSALTVLQVDVRRVGVGPWTRTTL